MRTHSMCNQLRVYKHLSETVLLLAVIAVYMHKNNSNNQEILCKLLDPDCDPIRHKM